MGVLVSKITDSEVENSILKVNAENAIKLSFEKESKVLSIKTRLNGIPDDKNYIEGDTIIAPK